MQIDFAKMIISFGVKFMTLSIFCLVINKKYIYIFRLETSYELGSESSQRQVALKLFEINLGDLSLMKKSV